VARDKRVVNLLLLLVVVGVLVEVAESWLAWWGGSNAAAPITGTFYWYDPFAAFLIAGTVLGLSLWLRRTGPVATLGLVTFALGSIGLVYSTSRAADACFALAAIIVCGVHLLSNRVQGLRRVAVALAVGAFSVWAIAGPPFFAHRALPLAGTSARASGQSLGQNGGYRMDFWREALGVFRRHVLTGGGFHSLAAESQGHVPATWPLSPLAHNGYLQALSDGGLLLGVPFVLAALAVAWWVLSALVRSVRARDFSTQAFVLPLCLGALLAHSVVDFDWSYAADFTLVAILAGVLAGTRYSERTPHRSSLSSRAVAGAVLAGVVLTGVAAVTSWPGDVGQSLPITHAAPTWEAM
jgi:hypothetical protein